MQDVTLEVTLILQGPILTHSTVPGASHLSSLFARNRQGRHYIPGSLVKGRLREAWAELESAAGNFLQTRCGLTKEQLLGEVSGNQQNNAASTAPKRSRLYFDNFEDRRERTAEPEPERVRYRIKLDEARGSVSKGAYQVIEAPYAAGEEVSFIGQIHFRTSDTEQAEKIKECIQIGLRWVTNLGANCNVGFGRLLDAQVMRGVSPESEANVVTATGAERWELVIKPELPFCITRRRVADNLFESEDIIPGAVLKGSVAHTLRTLRGDSPDEGIVAGADPTRPELCANFHLIRFTHAFPAPENQRTRPVTPPLSLVKVRDEANKRDDVYDVALFQKPILVQNKQREWIAPTFAIDWKNDSDVQQVFGWMRPKRELRVRTKIDAKRRKAEDEQLFAYEMVVPDETDWYASIDLSAIVDLATRRKVEEQLLSLLAHELHGFSKTKVKVKVASQAAGSLLPKFASNRTPQFDTQTQEQFWVVTLQTPTILCEPQTVNSSGLFDAYQQAWTQLSSSALQLKHFFAQQSLSGGYYLYRRFMKDSAYFPYFLTEPGSVFVLAAMPGKEANAQAYIDDWLACGLPLPAWAITEYQRDGLSGDDWRNCPYLREGGYGEIAVNLAVHFDSGYQPQEVKQL